MITHFTATLKCFYLIMIILDVINCLTKIYFLYICTYIQRVKTETWNCWWDPRLETWNSKVWIRDLRLGTHLIGDTRHSRPGILNVEPESRTGFTLQVGSETRDQGPWKWDWYPASARWLFNYLTFYCECSIFLLLFHL